MKSVQRLKPPRGYRPSAPPMSVKDVYPFVVDLVNLKHRAGQLGLFATMQELDKAVKRVGYEIAEKRATSRKDAKQANP